MTAFGEVEDALAWLYYLDDQANAQTRAVEAAQTVASLSRDRDDSGLVSFFEVVDAERTALEVERALTAIRREQYAAKVALMRAVGAGWTGIDAVEPAGEGLLATLR